MGVLVIVTGVFENIVIVDRAILVALSIHLALRGAPRLTSGIILGLYLCSTSTSMGLLAVNVAVLPKSFHLALLEEQLLSDVG